MTFQSLMSTTQRLCASMDALAALCAELRLRRMGEPTTAEVRGLLREVVHHFDPQLLSDISPDQEAIALGIIESFFRQALDLLENPARNPGWSYADPTVINGQGMTSRAFVRTFERISTSVPDFRNTLNHPGIFLDVGTGAGWLAIEVARCWPSWRVVGIDCWEPSLQLARTNIAASGVKNRIELRLQSAEELQEENAFSIAWLPGPFLPKRAVLSALQGVKRSLKPGGWVVFSLFSPPAEPWGQAVTALKVTRNGGYPWQRQELEDRLRDLGLSQVGTFSTVGSTVTIGQREAV
jgi:SAM-dependent methyltransferase